MMRFNNYYPPKKFKYLLLTYSLFRLTKISNTVYRVKNFVDKEKDIHSIQKICTMFEQCSELSKYDIIIKGYYVFYNISSTAN